MAHQHFVNGLDYLPAVLLNGRTNVEMYTKKQTTHQDFVDRLNDLVASRQAPLRERRLYVQLAVVDYQESS